MLQFHCSHSKIGTLTGVRPLSRFGEIICKDGTVKEFAEKPQSPEGHII